MFMRKLFTWIQGLRFRRFLKRQGVRPHPTVESDQGERRYSDKNMEMDSLHVGRQPR